MKDIILLARRLWRGLCNVGLLHKFESVFVGCSALHVAALSHSVSESIVNVALGSVMFVILFNQIRGGSHD